MFVLRTVHPHDFELHHGLHHVECDTVELDTPRVDL